MAAKTYLVRTAADQVLIGLFCEKSIAALVKTISGMIDPKDCEYIVLREGEGLFVEAQFVSVSLEASEAKEDVFLTNEPEQFVTDESCGEGGSSRATEQDVKALKNTLTSAADSRLAEQIGDAFEDALKEVIPPVLEPTEALSKRFNAKALCGWRRLVVALSAECGKAKAPMSAMPILVMGASTRFH